MGRERLAVGHGRAAARERSASRVRTSVASLPRPPQRAGMERHRRGLALAARGRHRAQRTGRVGDDGVAAAAADIADVYVERVNPANPHQVQYRGRWVNTTIVPDPIVMKGQAKPFPFEREHTPNGVIVATDSERHLAFSLKWSGSEPGTAGELAALALARADSASGFRASLARWKMPAVEVVYAAVDGAAGRQAAGLLPVRSGWDGALPAPGWPGVFEWRGWRRLDDLPHAVAPPAGGYVVSANQNAARTNRLDELLDGAHAAHGRRLQAAATRHDRVERRATRAAARGTWRPIEARSRRRAGCSCSGTGALPRIQRRQRSTCSGRSELLRKLAESRLAPDLRNELCRAGRPADRRADDAVARVV